MLSKEWAHARREAAHFASETMNAKTMLEHIRAAQRLPEPLEMSNASRTDEKQDGTALNADKQTKRAENSRQDVNDDLDGTPEEVSKRLTDKIAIQKDLLARLEQQLAKFKSGDPAAGRRLPSSWAYRGDVEAMKAIRKQKIAEAMKQREVPFYFFCTFYCPLTFRLSLIIPTTALSHLPALSRPPFPVCCYPSNKSPLAFNGFVNGRSEFTVPSMAHLLGS
jgi:hypothetical protein